MGVLTFGAVLEPALNDLPVRAFTPQNQAKLQTRLECFVSCPRLKELLMTKTEHFPEHLCITL